jgi:transcriptional regulator with XRE-family HTH domain
MNSPVLTASDSEAKENKSLGKNNANIYRLLRIANDISVNDMADKLLVSRAYVNEIESGRKKPSKRLIRSYAQVFGINEDILYTFAPDRETDPFGKILSKLLNLIYHD